MSRWRSRVPLIGAVAAISLIGVTTGVWLWNREGEESTTPSQQWTTLESPSSAPRYSVGFDASYSIPAAGDVDGILVSSGELASPIHSGRITLFDTTGVMKWQRSLPDLPLKPSLSRGMSYVGTAGGSVVAINRGTGAEVWSRKVSTFPLSQVESIGSILVVAAHDPGNMGLMTVANPSSKARVYGLDANTGRTQWVTDLAGSDAFISAEVVSGTILVGSAGLAHGRAEGTVARVRVNDGTVLWKRALGAVRPYPLVASNFGIIAADGTVMRIDMSGRVVWRVAEGTAQSHPVLSGNTVIVSTSDSTLEARDARTGKLLWQSYVPTLRTPAMTEIFERSVIAAGARGFARIDIRNGKTIGRHAASEIVGTPQLSKGSVVGGTFGPTIARWRPDWS